MLSLRCIHYDSMAYFWSSNGKFYHKYSIRSPYLRQDLYKNIGNGYESSFDGSFSLHDRCIYSQVEAAVAFADSYEHQSLISISSISSKSSLTSIFGTSSSPLSSVVVILISSTAFFFCCALYSARVCLNSGSSSTSLKNIS